MANNVKDRTVKYTFSTRESFLCKTLWLKKGYDFVVAGNDFNSPEDIATEDNLSICTLLSILNKKLTR